MSAPFVAATAELGALLAQAWQHLMAHDLAQAKQYARQAAQLAPDSPAVAHVLGLLASRDERPDLALPLLQKALNGGVTARRLRDMAEALLVAGKPQAALAPIQHALRQFGETSEALGLLAAIQVALEDFDAASRAAARAIALKPELLAWEGTLAFCELIRGNFVSGLQAWSGREQNRLPGSRCPTLQFAQPGDMWLKNEEGPGDTLFYLRHAPALVAMGWRLHVQSHIRTQKLLQDTGLFASVSLGFACPQAGFWINVGDLPLAAIQLGLAAVAPPLPLRPQDKRSNKMRKLLKQFGPPPYIAVSWRGGPRGRKLRDGIRMFSKQIPPLELGRVLAPLAATIISIQRAPEAEEAKAFAAGLGRPYLDLARLNDKLPDMLALLDSVDEYVAVPNTNLHLREALGKSSQILINRPYQDWRWMIAGNSPWYPKAHCYRQQPDGSWEGVLQNLQAALRAKFGIAPRKVPQQQADPWHDKLLAGWNALVKKDKDVAGAIAASQEILAQHPNHAGAHHLLGWAAFCDTQFDLATRLLARAYELDPHDGRIVGAYVRCLAVGKQADAAIALATKALTNAQLRNRSSVFYGRAAAYFTQDRLPEAIADYEAVLQINPNRLDAMEYLGMARLKLGDARAGFRAYSARQVVQRPKLLNDWCCPCLRPEHRGSRILIKRDMGLGDELTYLRYLPWLTAAGMVVDYWGGKKLLPILARMGYLHQLWPDDAPPPDAQGYDLSFVVNELPIAVEQLGAPAIAPPLPLSARPDLTEKWRAWLNSCGPGPYIGITYRAGVAAADTAMVFGKLAKAVDAALLAEALQPIHATFISLQRNALTDEIAALRQRLGAPLQDVAALTDDLEDLLALLSLLDENVGVSNTNMHLRAGLGLGSRVLVQTPCGDWRWGHTGNTSPWFTASQVYRQTLNGGWDEALQALQADLLEKYGNRKACLRSSMVDASAALPAAVGQREEPTAGESANHLLTRRLLWLTAGKIKTEGGCLTSDLASTRYRVLMPGQTLAKWGWRSDYVNESVSHVMGGWVVAPPQPGDSVIISKVFTEHAIKLARDAKARGAQVIVDFCDDFFDHAKRGPVQKSLLALADKVVASTEAMARAIENQGAHAAAIIADPVELPKGAGRFHPGPILKLLWFGHAVNFDTLAQFLPGLAQYAKEQPLHLTVVTQLPNGAADLAKILPAGIETKYTAWSIEATKEALADCDIVIIPTLDHAKKACKSPNRLVEALWAGRFVVAGPLPAYHAFRDSAWVGDDLIAGIRWALENPNEVVHRIRQGQQEVEQFFSAEAIGKAWENAITIALPSHESAASMAQPQGVGGGKRLNLGCGDKILPGYINVDVVENRAGKKPDVVCDLRKLEPFADNSVDEILAVHVVEHFWRWEVLAVLKEWVRVLRPGGKMILECPNLITACQEFLKNPELAATGGPAGQRSMWVFYGDPRWQDPYMVHRWGYTPHSLAKLMEEAGLIHARQEPAQFKLREPRDMRVVAEKPVARAVPAATSQPQSIQDERERRQPMNQAVTSAARMQLPGNKSLEEHLWDGYLTWFYHTNVWKQMTWHGIRTLKLPSDMWNYQEILHERKVDWVIETGTRHGGSALFFAEALAARQAKGRVISIDIDASARQLESHPGIEFLLGDSSTQEMVDRVAAMLPQDRGPLFLILDSDHTRGHVLRELEVWVPFLRTGDYLVVEDTAINGHPVRLDFGPGPYEAVKQFIASHPGLLNHDAKRERKFGATQAPLGYFIKT